MKLLVSPINVEEAIISMKGGADIIDVKNPTEGSLGANFPWVIRSVVEAINSKTPVSATIGDFNFKPGTASLAALGAAASGADYIKVGLFDIQTKEQALELAQCVVKSVKDYDPTKNVVISGYADYKRINSIPVNEIPSICSKAGADVAMMDTGVKDGRSTFEFMSNEQLSQFTESTRELGLISAIAGSLKFEDVDALNKIDPDIIGIRGCVCGGDRNSTIQQQLVEELKASLS
jgi:uncharacterized protein (UPF0264 family)